MYIDILILILFFLGQESFSRFQLALKQIDL